MPQACPGLERAVQSPIKPKRQPDKLIVVWTRRNRRICSKESKGHRKVLASVDVNMRKYASAMPTQTDLTLRLKPLSVKVVEATLKLSLSCVFLREGKATSPPCLLFGVQGETALHSYLPPPSSQHCCYRYKRSSVPVAPGHVVPCRVAPVRVAPVRVAPGHLTPCRVAPVAPVPEGPVGEAPVPVITSGFKERSPPPSVPKIKDQQSDGRLPENQLKPTSKSAANAEQTSRAVEAQPRAVSTGKPEDFLRTTRAAGSVSISKQSAAQPGGEPGLTPEDRAAIGRADRQATAAKESQEATPPLPLLVKPGDATPTMEAPVAAAASSCPAKEPQAQAGVGKNPFEDDMEETAPLAGPTATPKKGANQKESLQSGSGLVGLKKEEGPMRKVEAATEKGGRR
ncbi:UNVERIFIED_CONTAM: hypothetical protein FKN15_038873 [Acipenser sinensis]